MKILLLALTLFTPSFSFANGKYCVAHIGHHTYFSCEGAPLVPVNYPPFVPSIGSDLKLANTHRMSYVIAEYRGLGYEFLSCDLINEDAEAICFFRKKNK